LDAEGVQPALAQASPERKPEFRATAKSPDSFARPPDAAGSNDQATYLRF
jgi:hypothetical protein